MTPEELDGKNLTELLAMLTDIPTPPSVPMWPQTPGWIILALVLIAAAVFATRALRHRRHARAYRKTALHALAQAKDDPAEIAFILRRAALSGFPRIQVAGLIGDDWLTFLDNSFPGSGFADGPGRALTTAAYRDTPANPALTKLAEDWITHHMAVPP